MQMNAYLTFDGECEAAFKFYEQRLRGKIAMKMTHGESPMGEQTPPAWRNKIMHARLVAGDAVLMGSDAPPGRYEKPKGVWVSLGVDKPAEAERILSRAGGERHGRHAAPKNLLGRALRHACRPLRDPVDDQLRGRGLSPSAAARLTGAGQKVFVRISFRMSLSEAAVKPWPMPNSTSRGSPL
jgi:PhnB protein